MPRRLNVVPYLQHTNAGVLDLASITGCNLPASLGPLGYTRQERLGEDRCLQLVQPAIKTTLPVKLVAGLPVVAEHSGMHRNVGLVSQEGAAVSECA